MRILHDGRLNVIGIVLLFVLSIPSSLWAQAGAKPSPIVIGRIEVAGTLRLGIASIGGGSPSSTKMIIDEVMVSVRISKDELRRVSEEMRGKRVWLEGALSFEYVFDEFSGQWKPELVIKADEVREPRELENKNINQVTVRGIYSESVLQFRDANGPRWTVTPSDDDVRKKLSRLSAGKYQFTGKISYDSKSKQWGLSAQAFERDDL